MSINCDYSQRVDNDIFFHRGREWVAVRTCRVGVERSARRMNFAWCFFVLFNWNDIFEGRHFISRFINIISCDGRWFPYDLMIYVINYSVKNRSMMVDRFVINFYYAVYGIVYTCVSTLRTTIRSMIAVPWVIMGPYYDLLRTNRVRAYGVFFFYGRKL